MDIENSPGAGRGPGGPAARNILGQRLGGGGTMYGNCLCYMKLRDPCRERRMATLDGEHGSGVLWHHCSVNLEGREPDGRGLRPSKDWKDNLG